MGWKRRDFGRGEHEPNPMGASGVSHMVNTVAADPEPLDAGAPDARARVAPADFEAMFHGHYERLVRALTVVAGDRETAADAVQEAFVRAHLRWRKVGAYDDPTGWVRRVAINRLRDEHRRTRRQRRAIDRLGTRPEPVTAEPDVDEFGRLLAQLPRQQRLATAFYYVDELTVAEIAETLGIAEGSVKSHLHDARQRLRNVLTQEAHDG